MYFNLRNQKAATCVAGSTDTFHNITFVLTLRTKGAESHEALSSGKFKMLVVVYCFI